MAKRVKIFFMALDLLVQSKIIQNLCPHISPYEKGIFNIIIGDNIQQEEGKW
jgi:hypothetical protein